MYVHFDTEAARHAFRVATGLDSMVVGEAQILGPAAGRVRASHRAGHRRPAAARADAAGAASRQARARRDRHRPGRSERCRGGAAPGVARSSPTGSIAGRSALVVGAGSTGGLALATLRRHGAGQLLVTNRDPQRAARLAELHGATAVPLTDLRAAVDQVDLVICATAADGHVLTREHVTAPTVILDLAVPRDVDPAVGRCRRRHPDRHGPPGDRRGSRQGRDSPPKKPSVDIVAAEVDAFRLQLRGADVAPTVAALRARADDVVAAELAQLRTKRPDLTDEQRADVAQTVHRIVQRLLHTPSVRVRELAAEPGGDRYAELLRDLFGLDVPPVADYAEIPTVVERRWRVSRWRTFRRWSRFRRRWGTSDDPSFGHPRQHAGAGAERSGRGRGDAPDRSGRRAGRDRHARRHGPARRWRTSASACSSRRCATRWRRRRSTSPCTPTRTCPRRRPTGCTIAADSGARGPARRADRP